MRFYTMWHPVNGWGGPSPVMMDSKQKVVQATGLSLTKVRKMGWRWIVIDIDTNRCVAEQVEDES